MAKEYLINWVFEQFHSLIGKIWYRLSWSDDRSALLFIYGGQNDGPDTFEIRQTPKAYEVSISSGEMFVEVEFETLKEVVTFLGEYYRNEEKDQIT